MKAKIIYISGGDNLVMSEINSVFSDIRKKMNWGVDVAMFAVPVSGEDLMEKPLDISEVVVSKSIGIVDNINDLSATLDENKDSVLSVLGNSSVPEKEDNIDLNEYKNDELQDPICDKGQTSTVVYDEEGPKVFCSENLDSNTEDVIDNQLDDDSVEISFDEYKEDMDNLEENEVINSDIDDELDLESSNFDDNPKEDETINTADEDSIIHLETILTGIEPMKQDDVEDDLDEDSNLRSLANQFINADIENEQTKSSTLSKFRTFFSKKTKKEDNTLSLFDAIDNPNELNDDIPSFLKPKNI